MSDEIRAGLILALNLWLAFFQMMGWVELTADQLAQAQTALTATVTIGFLLWRRGQGEVKTPLIPGKPPETREE